MNPILRNNALQFGTIMGVFSVLVTAIIYATDLNLFIKPWIGMTTLLIYVVLGIILVLKTKKDLKGLTFKEAFTSFFLAAVVSLCISTVFNMVLFNLIDPQAKETIKELTINYSVDIMEKMNTPKSVIKEAVKNMQQTDNYSVTNLIKGLMFSLIFSAIFAALLALIFRNKISYQE